MMNLTSSLELIFWTTNENHSICFIFMMHNRHIYFKARFFWYSLNLCYIPFIDFSFRLKLSISVECCLSFCEVEKSCCFIIEPIEQSQFFFFSEIMQLLLDCILFEGTYFEIWEINVGEEEVWY